ncbi:DUF1206 domain-containing protein [Marmoricola sp. RAF53]|uniref:DUF1206 domain-containing protein n=1 Tax=Marmoricola sp. RAF53 TaxID=3233059 RepID=UPI003F96D9F3
MNTRSAAEAVQDAGEQAAEHPAFDRAVRLGQISYGVVHLLLAWLALQLVLGQRTEQVSKTGALHELAKQPFGSLLLWVLAAGFAALVLWQGLEALFGHRDADGGKRLLLRLGSLFRVVVFAVLGVSAVKVAVGSGTGGSNTQGDTARVMGLPLGPWLVGATGVAIVGYGVFNVVKGLTDGFEDHLDLSEMSGTRLALARALGRAGYCARGVAFGAIGVLFVWAAVTHDPAKSGGLDAALSRLLHAPLGPAVLVLIAAGLACFGGFCFLKARHFEA